MCVWRGNSIPMRAPEVRWFGSMVAGFLVVVLRLRGKWQRPCLKEDPVERDPKSGGGRNVWKGVVHKNPYSAEGVQVLR